MLLAAVLPPRGVLHPENHSTFHWEKVEQTLHLISLEELALRALRGCLCNEHLYLP